MRDAKEIVEEVRDRIAKLDQIKKEYTKKGNERGRENVKNRRDELERLLQFIRME